MKGFVCAKQPTPFLSDFNATLLIEESNQVDEQANEEINEIQNINIDGCKAYPLEVSNMIYRVC